MSVLQDGQSALLLVEPANGKLANDSCISQLEKLQIPQAGLQQWSRRGAGAARGAFTFLHTPKS